MLRGCHQNGDFSKDAILEINIEFQSIKIQEVAPMNLVALMANMNPDQNFGIKWQATYIHQEILITLKIF